MGREAWTKEELTVVQEIQLRVESQMEQYRDQLECETRAHNDCKEEMGANHRQYADHLGKLQSETDRLKWEDPQEISWCAMATEGESGSSHKVKCAIKKLQIQGQTRMCIIQMQT